MSISKRRKGHRHHHHKRRRLGGYISGSTERGVGYNKLPELETRESQKKKAVKLGLFNLPTWVDAKANKNVLDEHEMKRISDQYYNAKTENERGAAMNTLKDMLVINDINKNPKDYLKEWEKGKHRRGSWAKWLTRAGLGAAGIAAGYGLYQYGIPFLSGLFKSGTTAANVASAVASSDAAAQGVSQKTLDGLIEYLKTHQDITEELHKYFVVNNQTGSGYWRRRLKRRKHHKRK